jgi:hypothetical protein
MHWPVSNPPTIAANHSTDSIVLIAGSVAYILGAMIDAMSVVTGLA